MKIRFRVMALLLMLAMVTMLFSACGNNEGNTPGNKQDAERLQNLNMTGFPIVKEPITLKFMVSRHASQSSYKDILTWPTYEKMTNIHIEWDEVPSENIAERRNLVLASGQDLPDGFFRASFGARDIQRYGSEGTFLKLNDLIDKYMPNFKALLNDMDDLRKGLPTVDGSIYSLPGLSDCLEIELNPKIYLNKKFMDNVGVQMPTTTEEFYNVLKAMRDKDANKNGKKDEIPLTSNSWTNIRNAFFGAFGLMNRGSSHTNYDIDPKTGELRFIPTAPEFRQMLEYLNKLYTEQLIDNEIFTIKTANVTAKVEMDLVGGIVHTNTTMAGTTYVDDFTGLTEALEGPNGDKLWTAKRGHMSTKGGFVMTSTNPYPEATARWMDYWFTDEGSKLFYLGVEGESFYVTEDGKYEFIPEKIEEATGSTYDEKVSKFTPYAGGGSPVLALPKYFKGAELLPIPAKAAADLNKYTPKEIWGMFNFTDEESTELASLETDIFTGYYNNVVPEFITGKRPINDETWNEYVAKYETMGLKRMTEIYNNGLQRYKAIK